ncbi:hypothetical protein llap_3823 [Limosa lapponica baueri]|uniref:Rna-directed dna polymerase from mobile element jockey-like n=1 Tax=Limosa lapponica baueri TaxID=1758121 RepID=A0A2I0UIL3_LIMLA|nr:hypothetical protein llap_3823 [Limosa lapponica baueri]
MYSRDQYRIQSCSTSSSMIWMMGQSVPSASLSLTQNCKDQLMHETFAAIQRDLHRQKKWAERNIMQFNKGNYKFLPLRRNNPRHQYMLGATELEGDPSPLFTTGEATPGVLCLVLAPTVQERHGATGESPVKGN